MDNFEQQLKQANKEWCDAGYKESVIREFAFLGITQEICGIEVNAFTPLHFLLLDFLNSPFLNIQNNFTEGDIFQFLYIISTDYRRGDKAHYTAFITKHSKINLYEATDAICEYINDAFLDAPPTLVSEIKSNKRPYTAWCTPYIDQIAAEYGWSDEYILRLPFTRLWQYVKAIDARKLQQSGQRPVLFNKYSDRAQEKITTLLRQKAEMEGKVVVSPEPS